METTPIDVANYSHSPAHAAVASNDHATLRHLLQSLPTLHVPSHNLSTAEAAIEDSKSDAISAVVDRRDVPNRETPLHLAVRLNDATAAELLMVAGADWTLQNHLGWNALQEAVCNKVESVAMVIYIHSKPLAWAKWCRRLPKLNSALKNMRDFYIEMSFHFESSVIPFISRMAPSDTYRIWKRGSNLRADMTLAGFDGFKIQRSDQSVLFLGEGCEENNVVHGSLCLVFHKDKEVVNAWEGAGEKVKGVEAQRYVAALSRSKVSKPGINMTQAVLVPQMNWRRHERSEMVGKWKAKVYDVHNVVFSVRSRQVLKSNNNAATHVNENSVRSSNEAEAEGDGEAEATVEEYEELLSEDERRQLELAFEMEGGNEGNEGGSENGHSSAEDDVIDSSAKKMHSCSDGEVKQKEKRGWFGRRKHRDVKHEGKKLPRLRSSPCLSANSSNFEGIDYSCELEKERHSVEIDVKEDEEFGSVIDAAKSFHSSPSINNSGESEYKKGLRPVLWLSPDFPLKVEEFLPLLDILANKVKAIRRLRELLTTKLRPGTFPVQVAIPVVPTVQVLVTFTKFEELQQSEDFCTPPSSPTPEDLSAQSSKSSMSWRQWIKAPYRRHNSSAVTFDPVDVVDDNVDPFAIPPDYTWTTSEGRRKRQMRNRKPRRPKPQEK
ncbi:hypothetical protein Scep_029291 [Stephania cephalantha]|uniref:Ankyrin repeat domain-containing protein n=1 Tax=Stephania cephalantha TaxID=152367 RepID=A0AAP0E0C6_9MAGN